MEFQEFCKERKRMCDAIGNCNKCEIDKLRRLSHPELSDNCYDACCNHPKKAEAIVQKWMDEHPIVTNAEKFKEVFGKDNCFKDIECTGGEVTCRNKLPCMNCSWWDEEYKEPEKEVES